MDAPKLGSMNDLGRLALMRRRLAVAARQSARLAWWAVDEYTAPTRVTKSPHPVLLYEKRVPLARTDPGVDPTLERGKRQNVALAAPAFDGLVLQAGQPLSMWRTLGRLTERAGYVAGMELRGGCVVPAIGGGVCLISNALFELAARCGFDILERHGHSLEVIDSPRGGLWGLDATLYWPHVDLVVAPRHSVKLGMVVEGEHLVLRLHGAEPMREIITLAAEGERIVATPDGPIHIGRIVRRRNAVGRPRSEEVVAINRKRVVAAPERRSCLDCAKPDCHTGRVARKLAPAAG